MVGGSWPTVVSVAGDSEMAFHSFNGSLVSGTFTLTGFGFTSSDIPPTASIAGIQIEITSAGITFSGTQLPLDKTVQLVGVTHGPTPNLASSIPYTTTATGVDVGNNPAAYTYTAKEYGAPSNVVNTPTSLLGYTGITQPDIVNTNFGVSYAVTMNGTATNNHVYFSVDQVRMRVTYLPETNQIYFWNGTSAVRAQVVQHYQQGGSLASSTASGTLYIQFINASGTVGGTPTRPVGSGETIRTYPTNGATPDGGAADGSTLLATSASTALMNVMDWSATLTGAPQPDGSTSPPSKYQSVTKNFYASSGLEAIYGVSGGGPAFYYSGIKLDASGNVVPGNFARILTGLPLQFETPRGIEAHQGHIMLAYYAGVVQ